MADRPPHAPHVAALLRRIATSPPDGSVSAEDRRLAQRALDAPAGLTEAEIDALSEAMARYRLAESGL